MIQKFALSLIVAALQNEEVRKFLLEVIDRLAAQLLPKLAAVIPAAVGAGIKGFGDLVDVDLPDVGQVVEKIRDGVNAQLPEDVDIPVLSDAFTSLTGLDLTDWLKGRH